MRGIIGDSGGNDQRTHVVCFLLTDL